ncbi:MAG: DUF4433 domain-containing protein [Candidatus Omnitrophota bacterium]
MNQRDIKELYFITPIDNIPSIFQHGIMSHNKIRASKLSHKSVAHGEVQKRREDKVIPGGKRKLHNYVNLYFNPRNSMMYSRKNLHEDLCVLAVHADVLTHQGIIIADGNASSNYTRFFETSEGIKSLDKDSVFTENWWDPDHYEMCRKRSAACAEALFPDQLPPSKITGIYVSSEEAHGKVASIIADIRINIPVIINGKMFFKEA